MWIARSRMLDEISSVCCIGREVPPEVRSEVSRLLGGSVSLYFASVCQSALRSWNGTCRALLPANTRQDSRLSVQKADGQRCPKPSLPGISASPCNKGMGPRWPGAPAYQSAPCTPSFLRKPAVLRQSVVDAANTAILPSSVLPTVKT